MSDLLASFAFENSADLGREILLRSFGVSALGHIWDLEPASQSALEHFQSNSNEGPSVVDAKLDTLSLTLAQMKDSLWNQTLIFKLARYADTVVRNSDYSGEQINWDRFFTDRIHRILREGCKKSTTSGVEKHRQSIRAWKFKRRQAIASLEQQACREKGDEEGDNCWGFVLYSVLVLQVDGMSDEKDGVDKGEEVKSVLDLAFRRSEFRGLFRIVDLTRDRTDPGQGGRRFKKRVEVPTKVERAPLADILSSFVKSGYRSKDSVEDPVIGNALSRTLEYFRARGNLEK